MTFEINQGHTGAHAAPAAPTTMVRPRATSAGLRPPRRTGALVPLADPPANTIEDTFTRANQTGWGTSTNTDSVPNVAWGLDGDGTKSYVTISNNGGMYAYQGSTNVIGIAAAGSTTYNGGDDLVRFAVSAVGHVTPYVVQNACSDKSCYYGARLHTAQNELELAKRSGNSTTELAGVPFTATANTFYWMRLDVVPGTSATLQAKIWADGTPEPGTWMVTATDSSPLAANVVGTGGSWDVAGSGESIRYACYAYVSSGLASPCGNTIEDTFTRANQAGWGTSTNNDGVPNVAWGLDGDGTKAYVTISGNTGTYGYQGSTNVIGIAAAGSTTYNGGDDLVRFAVSAVGHATPYVVQNACSDKSCYYGARLHTSQNKLELAKRSGGSTSILASVPFTPTANTFYWMRLDMLPGASTTLRARIWADGTTEPTVWMVTATDSTPLAANLAGRGGSWDLAGTGESIQYTCYAYVTGGLATPCPAARPPQPIGVSTVQGSFFANYGDVGAFDITPGTAPVFTEQFPTIDFNPPTSAQVGCSNDLGLGTNPTQTRPMVDVVPLSNGSCTTQVAQGNGYQAGVNFRGSYPGDFEAVYTATLSIATSGPVTFTMYSDDGWVFSMGPNSAGQQPARIETGSDPEQSPPPAGPFTGYQVMGANNIPTSASLKQTVVNIPAPGSYPIEVDYTECQGDGLVLTMGSSYGNPFPPQSFSVPGASGTTPWHPHKSVRFSDGLSASVDLADGHLDVAADSLSVAARVPDLAEGHVWDSALAQAGLTGSAGQGWQTSLTPSMGGVLTSTVSYTAADGAVWLFPYTGALTATAPYTAYQTPAGLPWALSTAPTTATATAVYTLTNVLSNETLAFDAQGRYLTDTDAYGNHNSLSYGASGPISETNSGGRVLGLAYSNGLLSDVQTPLWRSSGGAQGPARHLRLQRQRAAHHADARGGHDRRPHHHVWLQRHAADQRHHPLHASRADLDPGL